MEKTVDNKLQSILSEDVYGFPYKDLTGSHQLAVDQAIAAIKEAFLEMESMQDSAGYQIEADLRQAVRKEVNHG